MRVQAGRTVAHPHRRGVHPLPQHQIPVDGPEVEEGLGVQEGVGVRCGDPGVEGVLPLAGGLPPLGVGGHHVARAQDLAGRVEALADELGEVREILSVLGLVIVVRQDHGVVLVGGHPHLPAPLGAQHHEGIGHRWWAETFLPDHQQPARQGVGGDGHEGGGLLGGGTAVYEPDGDLGGTLVGVPHLLGCAAPGEVGGEVDGVVAEQPHDVRGGDDSGDLSVIDHGKMVDGQFRHEQHGLEGQAVGGHGPGVGGHDLGDGRRDVEAGGHDPAAEIAVGDDPLEDTVVHDEQ